MRILVTGAAGFIGFHLIRLLTARGDSVVGIDNLNDYYSVALKRDRLAALAAEAGDRFKFHQVDFADMAALNAALADEQIDRVVHLGAQAGVRYSLENPQAYVASNLAGHVNLLELARHRMVQHMVYASSSSVYGGNAKLPFAVPDDPVESALAEWVEARGGNAFMEISVPDAALKLVQASGRLLRTEEDSGRITLLDRRVITRAYGRRILDSLPPFRREVA